MRVLVVGGSPEIPSPGLLWELASAAGAVVAVDRGLDALIGAGVSCDLFCGDADSVGSGSAALVLGGSAPFEVERYNTHKDATDLELALRSIARRWPGSDLVATALSGGKPDHFLAALGRLLSWRDGSVELREEGFLGRLIHAGQTWDLADFQGRRFSFVPLSHEAVVSESGMRWELDHRRAPLLDDLGIANELDGPDPVFCCHEGSVGAWVYL